MRKAFANDDYIKFFKLYKSSKNMTPYLIDIFIDRIRLRFFRLIAKSL